MILIFFPDSLHTHCYSRCGTYFSDRATQLHLEIKSTKQNRGLQRSVSWAQLHLLFCVSILYLTWRYVFPYSFCRVKLQTFRGLYAFTIQTSSTFRARAKPAEESTQLASASVCMLSKCWCPLTQRKSLLLYVLLRGLCVLSITAKRIS